MLWLVGTRGMTLFFPIRALKQANPNLRKSLFYLWTAKTGARRRRNRTAPTLIGYRFEACTPHQWGSSAQYCRWWSMDIYYFHTVRLHTCGTRTALINNKRLHFLICRNSHCFCLFRSIILWAYWLFSSKVSFVCDSMKVSHLRMRNNNNSNLHFILCFIMPNIFNMNNIIRLNFMNIEFILHMEGSFII